LPANYRSALEEKWVKKPGSRHVKPGEVWQGNCLGGGRGEAIGRGKRGYLARRCNNNNKEQSGVVAEFLVNGGARITAEG
jgi:hypothetical protein